MGAASAPAWDEIARDAVQKHAPRALHAARRNAHQLAQIVADAARANLPAAPDFSHLSQFLEPSGLHATHLCAQPLPGAARLMLELQQEALEGRASNAGPIAFRMHAEPGRAVSDVRAALDAFLTARELAPAAAVEPDLMAAFEPTSETERAALAGWFLLADEALNALAGALKNLSPGPSPVRCWPHHFDIATYVALEEGDPETAKGVGIGMSPGDESYDQPYFYVNPWPAPPADALPAAPAPGRWRTEGFTGVVVTAEELLSADVVKNGGEVDYLAAAFAAAREAIMR